MIAEILAGRTEAFHDLIRPYERSVYMMVLSMLRNEAEAEDVAQETFIKAYRNLGRFRSESRFSTWLIAIALNEARARLRRKQPALTDSIDDTEGSRRPGSAHRLARDSIRDPGTSGGSFAHSPRSTLFPLPYREVFVLRELEERNVQETAETLGITIASVKMRLHRARMMLQKQLAPQLISSAPKRRRRFPWF